MRCDRTSMGTVDLHTGDLRVLLTDDNKVFKISASFSEEGEFGLVECLVPVMIQIHKFELSLAQNIPVIFFITCLRTLPSGQASNSRWISLRSLKSVPLLTRRTSP